MADGPGAGRRRELADGDAVASGEGGFGARVWRNDGPSGVVHEAGRQSENHRSARGSGAECDSLRGRGRGGSSRPHRRFRRRDGSILCGFCNPAASGQRRAEGAGCGPEPEAFESGERQAGGGFCPSDGGLEEGEPASGKSGAGRTESGRKGWGYSREGCEPDASVGGGQSKGGHRPDCAGRAGSGSKPSDRRSAQPYRRRAGGQDYRAGSGIFTG